MPEGILLDFPEVIQTYNVSRSISTTIAMQALSVISKKAISIETNPYISLAACLGFAVLILTTVLGNTMVLSALFLDKRLHSPSFFLIANMATADLLLGLSVLPFSSLLEILDDRWIFGQGLCSTWLALDVLCCTASIIALMAISIDRYIGVTRPLKYSSIMTTRRTVYLIIIVWAVSILTSVVPLFGLTDRGKKSKDISSTDERFETCKVNKNTFYTIFSSMMSFYIPVIILLILYSRVYQEAKIQGEKLEKEKRRLYEIDFQIVSEQVRQQQNHSNGHVAKNRVPLIRSNDNKNEASTKLLSNETIPDEEGGLQRTFTSNDGVQLKKAYSDHKNNADDDASNSEASVAPEKKRGLRFFGKHLFTTIKRNSILNTAHLPHYHHHMKPTDELLIIKRKIHNLKREKKAFRTLGLILGALLICWLPFFVTLPVVSILKHRGIIDDGKAESVWFTIAFWLGYCNSALNPFVYAFSNRAIRRAFREVICRRCCCCCCCICRKKSNEYNEQQTGRRQRAYSGSLTTDTSQIYHKRTGSLSTDAVRAIPNAENDPIISADTLFRAPNTGGPVVSFADFLADTGDDDKQETISTPIEKNLPSTLNS